MRARAVVLLLVAALTASACSVHRLSDEQTAGPGAARRDGADAALGSGSATGALTPEEAAAQAAAAAAAEAEAAAAARLPTANSAGGEARRASDVGVTEGEIHLGILHTAASFVDAAGGAPPDPVDQIIAPFIKEINDAGGINGRKVVPRISEYDPLSADSMQAACVQQAEDHKVFTSIAQIGFYGEAEVCMASKGVPLLTGNNSTRKTNYDRERGLVRQTSQNKDRNIKNWIDWMIESGLLQPGTRTGLLYVDVPEDRDLVNEIVLPYLKQRGMQDPVKATLSASIAQTPAEAQSAVLRFRSENVALVLPLVSFLRMLIFAQQAEGVGYRPEYSVSDFGLLSTDAMAGMPPAQWEGVTGITTGRTGEYAPGQLPTSASFAECNGVYERYGQRINKDGDSYNGLETAYMLHYCQHLALWADAARRAGANPTRASWLQALGSTGTWDHRVVLSARLTYTPDKYDGADLYKVVRWQAGCTSDGGCYREVAPFRPGKW